MRSGSSTVAVLSIVGIAVTLASCKRAERRFTETPPTATPSGSLTLTDQRPGPRTPRLVSSTRYGDNSYAMSEGKRLFAWYNCSGCHAHGGGGMGPALMDDQWIYGSDPENIVATIIQGRPNGMPSFRGRIPTNQVWQLAAYVRSMSGLNSKLALPSRNDDMEIKAEESKVQPEKPKPAATPPGAVRP